MARQLSPCGTSAGYARHWRAGEEPCEDCAQARREYNAARYAPRAHPRQLQPCGTIGAYQRHRYRSEKACPACLEAMRIHSATRKVPPRNPAKCGTNAAYVLHVKRGDVPCDPCREAHIQYQREYRAAKRAERDEFRQLLAEAWAETA